MSVPLYEITGDYAELLRRFEQAESEAELASIAELLARIEDRLEDKLDNCARVYRALCGESEIFAEESKRLSMKASMLENRAERLKEYIGMCLGVGKQAKSKLFSFSWRKSQAVEVDSLDILPEKYKRVKTLVEPDKEAIKEEFEQAASEGMHLHIDGVRLVERFNLQIK